MEIEKVNVLGVGISVLDQDRAREFLFQAVKEGRRGYGYDHQRPQRERGAARSGVETNPKRRASGDAGWDADRVDGAVAGSSAVSMDPILC
jgi:hypothetical protein